MLLNRRQFVAALLALTTLPARGQSVQAPGYVVHEPTEIAWILAGMSPLARGGNALRRDTDYWRAADAWFEPFASAPAITVLGDDFNLPRLIGNAANYSFDGCSRLVLTPGSRPMWDDGSGDLFSRHRSEIEDFIGQSRARTFLSQQSRVSEAVRTTLESAADLADMQGWLEAEFTARPGPMQVYVSPVTGGWNFTNLDPETPRLWVPAATPWTSDADRYRTVRSIFTEMNHNYVNPLTASLSAEAYSFMTPANGWAMPEAAESYSTAELVANEYLTFAAFLTYAGDRLNTDDLASIKASTYAMMTRRGFAKFDAFADAVEKRREALPAPMEALLPLVLDDTG